MADAPNRRIQVDLSGQVALVTGASRGIGQAIALTLGPRGAKVACLARNVEKLKAVADEIAAAGGAASVHACDVTDAAGRSGHRRRRHRSRTSGSTSSSTTPASPRTRCCRS